MSHNNRLRTLFEKYLDNSCSRDELDELLTILKQADREPEIKDILGDVWFQISQRDYSAEKMDMADRDEWFDEIFSQAQTREMISKGVVQAVTPLNKKKIVSRRLRPQWVNIAAILAISLFLSLAYHMINIEKENGTEVVALNQRVTAPGEKIRLILSDGTQVHLNSGSRIEFPDSFGENSREVSLDGEAYFDVTSDADRPFLVHSGEITTKVLGTSFNVRSYSGDEEVVVAVASGRVAVLESGAEVSEENFGAVLEANQYTSYRADQHLFNTNSGDISLFTAWNRDVLFYMDDALGEVAKRFELWYGVDIEFKDDEIKGCLVRGEHRGETLRNVLESITYAFVDMEYEINGREIVLSGRGCK